MSQQALGSEKDQRLPYAPAVLAAAHLAAEKMEILGRGCAIANLHIVFRAQLEEAFNAGAGVLWTLPLITVWQQQSQPDRLLPLAFGACDELVDDHLRAIDEVAKLGFPQYQRQR